MNEQKMCLPAAEIVQLKVVRTSSSNSTGVYERVQKVPETPFYNTPYTVDADPASKPEGDYVYAYANKPRKPTSADGNTLQVLTSQRPPEDDWNNDDDSRRRRYASLPLPPPPLPDREPAKFNIGLPLHRQSTADDDGSDGERPVVPPRRRSTSSAANSRRKQPPPPPDQPACLEVPEPHVADEDPTTPAAGRRSVEEQQPTPAIRHPSVEDVPEDVWELLSLAKQSQSQNDDDDNAGTPMTEPCSRNAVDPVNSQQQPAPPPGQSDEYLEVREPPAADKEPVAQPDACQSVEELSPQSTVAFCDLTVDDIADCLRQMNFHDHVDTFRRHDVDGTLLSSIDEEMLTSEFAMSRFEAKKLMMYVKEGWRPKVTDS